MLYIEDKDVCKVPIVWSELFDVIKNTVCAVLQGDYCQPIKPYVHFKETTNRIIAMPAYVGGEINACGIKWIASFPGNIDMGISRAHSVTILNNVTTGIPEKIMNSTILSVIRTAAVSGVLIQKYSEYRMKKWKVGILGWGPIGQMHFRVISEYFGNSVEKVLLYDIRDVDFTLDNFDYNCEVEIANSWEQVFSETDILITCTTANRPYINQQPKPGVMLMNVSLRDYKPEVIKWVYNSIIVDDWDEVCRENTDIENMHKQYNLQKEDVYSYFDMVMGDNLKALMNKSIFFNPMGMAVFDIAIAKYFADRVG